MSVNRKPKLLAIGFTLPTLGLTRVMYSILRPLQTRYDIHLIGISYRGEFRDDGIKLHPCNLKGGDIWGVRQGKEFVEKERPDLVFLFNDFRFLQKYMRYADAYTASSKVVAYFPLDGMLVDPQSLYPLRAVDQLVVYNEFCRSEVVKAIDTLRQEKDDAGFPPLSTLAHGVDLERFYPLTGCVDAQFAKLGRLLARQQLFPNDPDWHDAFIVLNANRAGPRKRIDLTIEGFARFAQGKPDNVKLYLHQPVIDERIHSELMSLAQKHGIVDRLKLSPVIDWKKQGFSDEELNVLYNACDVGINTSMGEGWGLISFEHGATGAAQIVPRHTACAELWDGVADFLEPVEVIEDTGLELNLLAVSAEEVAMRLEKLYVDPAYRQRQAQRIFTHVTQPRFAWQTIAEELDTLFQEVLQR